MYGGKSGEKSPLILILFLLCGIVIGGFIGEATAKIPYLSWLSYGKSFGMEQPFKVDLGIILFQLSLVIKFTVAGVLGMALSYIIYRKI